MKIKYTDEVKVLLRLSGMTNEQIDAAELQANVDLDMVPEPSEPISDHLQRKMDSSSFELMGKFKLD